MGDVLLSVLIATKNREKYCINSIEHILSLSDERIQIAISDNSDSNVIEDFVKSVNRPCISYTHIWDNISFVENFNRAMSLATGKYIMLIGDDDTILPNAVDIAAEADKQGLDSVCTEAKYTVEYYWPLANQLYPEGFLRFYDNVYSIKYINVDLELSKLVKNGLQHYLSYPLPKSYHGLVKREFMQKIKDVTGNYYNGLSPDIYSCVALSTLVKKHALINVPISVAGVCPESASAANMQGKHSGELDGIPQLKNVLGYRWSSLVPYYYSVNTIWADSGIKALEDFDKTNLLSTFSVYRLLVQGYVNNSKFIPHIVKRENEVMRRKLGYSRLEHIFLFGINLLIIVLKKIGTIIKSRFDKKYYRSFIGVEDVAKSVEIYRQNVVGL